MTTNPSDKLTDVKAGHLPTDALTPPEALVNSYEEFEIGHDRVPWFLWVFFTLIISWASISWIKFFGY